MSGVRIGSYGAMWGDSRIALPQLLGEKTRPVHYVVADYLAEFTMGILVKQKMTEYCAACKEEVVSMQNVVFSRRKEKLEFLPPRAYHHFVIVIFVLIRLPPMISGKKMNSVCTRRSS